MRVEKTKQVAAIANQFIQHARYRLTPREQKLILYMATLLRPDDSDFETYLVPVSEIEYILKTDETKKHGSFYERLDKLLDTITDKKISFPTDFTIDGVRLRGHINWIAGAVPKYDEDGVLCVEFGFSPQMKPFLLGLKEKFTRFEFLEVAKMKSGFSIRIYQMCKSYYYEHIRHGRNVLAVSIREMKHRLGISDKYPDFRNFRRKVLNVAKKEINEHTGLHIEYDFIKKGRSITDMRIVINEKDDLSEDGNGLKLLKPVRKKKGSGSSITKNIEKKIERLTEAQRRAFNTLTEYGVNMSFALGNVLPIIKGSELIGYEDFFVLFMLAFFEKKTNARTDREKAKAFAGWVNNRRFEEPNLYAQLMEQVIARKKRLRDVERTNRERAKNIAASEFRKLLKEEKIIGRSPEPAFTVQSKTAQAASRMNRVGEVVDLFTEKEKEAAVPKAVFDFDVFKKENAAVYRRIRKERRAAFEPLKTASNYRQLLENSVQAYCEQWFRAEQVNSKK